MKRDMEFARTMLLWMEDREDRIFYLNDGFSGLEADGEKILGHLALLISAGFVDQPSMHAYRMTWDGHEFLDKVRDDEIWSQTKNGASRLGSWSVKILSDLASGFIRAKALELGLPLG